jgi:hypothetical protein
MTDYEINEIFCSGFELAAEAWGLKAEENNK